MKGVQNQRVLAGASPFIHHTRTLGCSGLRANPRRNSNSDKLSLQENTAAPQRQQRSPPSPYQPAPPPPPYRN